jgi:hypothetical protein
MHMIRWKAASDLGGPRPADREPEPASSGAAGKPGGHVQHTELQPFHLGSGQLAREPGCRTVRCAPKHLASSKGPAVHEAIERLPERAWTPALVAGRVRWAGLLLLQLGGDHGGVRIQHQVDGFNPT